MSKKMVKTPFSPEQIAGLKFFQGRNSDSVHYVCSQCEYPYIYDLRYGRRISLVPTPIGMICPECGKVEDTEVYAEHTVLPFVYDGPLKAGADCPKCINENRTGNEIGKIRGSNPWGPTSTFCCTVCDFRQTGYDGIAFAIGF